MSTPIFWFGTVAACLLWSAMLTAGAARCQRRWLRGLLIAAGVVVPFVALAPWVAATAFLEFSAKLRHSWFIYTLSATMLALVGGIGIALWGLRRQMNDERREAADWPLARLAGAYVITKVLTTITLLSMHNTAQMQAATLHNEASTMMLSVVSPPLNDDANAAALYGRAFAQIDADKSLAALDSPLFADDPEVMGEAVGALLARHQTALDMVRQAAERRDCRFDRDWSRPSLDMPLPELQSMRTAARLLALAALRQAAEGHIDEALEDVRRITRMASHVGREPNLISTLVAVAIDTFALDALARILPEALSADSLRSLDDSEIGDVTRIRRMLARSLLGEEAFGLATLGDIGTGRLGLVDTMTLVEGMGISSRSPLREPCDMMFRTFILPDDVAGYRQFMRRYRQLTSQSTYAAARQEADKIEAELRQQRPGIVSGMIVPALRSVLTQEAKSQARQLAAETLLAATRYRLATGALPDSLMALVPTYLDALPIDPFDGKPMKLAVRDGAWTVYSIGPDDKDDGGPPALSKKSAAIRNDDVGLRMQATP